MKQNKHTWLITSLLVLMPFATYSNPPQWQIVPEESQLNFTATQNGAPVTGQFKSFTGQIFVDPKDYKSSHIDIIVDINSLTASYGELKATLMTSDWFNASLFPKAEFKSTDFEKTGDNTYQAHGNLTIRNQSAPVTLTFTTKQPAANKGVVEGNTVIKRTSFGVGQGEWASTKEIKDEVTVNFKVTAIKKE
jgi:polyisoprenoid-binding protein YceI